jgi:hypothetical protein
MRPGVSIIGVAERPQFDLNLAEFLPISGLIVLGGYDLQQCPSSREQVSGRNCGLIFLKARTGL